MSAGLSLLEQCPQSLLSLSCSISLTRWWTNCFHLPWFCIQYSAVILSDHSLTHWILTCELSASLIVQISLARIKHAICCNLGIDYSLSRATLVFGAQHLCMLPRLCGVGQVCDSTVSFLASVCKTMWPTLQNFLALVFVLHSPLWPLAPL